ncbi:MAG: hypothetical protein SCM96_03080 [Acidobacteriota bacterium]|nr:hypothetical protein [Acidobacteriota bacterium]
MALKDKDRAVNRAVDPALAEAVRDRIQGGTLDCTAAFALAAEKGVAPKTVGEAADDLDVHLSRCQIGLFGFPGHAKAWDQPDWKEPETPGGFEEAAHAAVDSDGSLSCASIWALAGRFGIPRAAAGFLADGMKFKIKRCQLGAF